MQNRTHHAATDIDHVKDGLAKLREDFGDLYDAALDLGRHAPGELKDKLSAGLKQLDKTARTRGGQAVEKIQNQVTERPIASVLIMFGVGLLFGAAMKRK